MNNQEQLQQFLTHKIKELDQTLIQQTDSMAKLKLASMRASYAKLMSNFLKDDSEILKGYLQHASVYLKNRKIQQAISYAQMAKRKVTAFLKNNNQKKIGQILKKSSEDIELILVECYLKSKRQEDALSVIEQLKIQSQENKQKYLTLKSKVYQALGDQLKSRQSYEQLHQLIINKYGQYSLEHGLCLYSVGKNLGHFQIHQEAINTINKSMQILINQRYHNPGHVAQIYETLAGLNKEVDDYQKQYSSLICAYSMIKQLQEDQQKRSVEVLSKLVDNLIKRNQKNKAFEFLLKIEDIELKIYGQSSGQLAKTVKKIISLLSQLNKISEAKKYESQYEHLFGNSRAKINKTVNHLFSMTNELQQNRCDIPQKSILRQKFKTSKVEKNISRVLK